MKQGGRFIPRQAEKGVLLMAQGSQWTRTLISVSMVPHRWQHCRQKTAPLKMGVGYIVSVC